MDIQRWDRAKEKVGNTFELTVLIQKRVRELIKERQKPLVDLDHRNPIQIALEEILQDKIYLTPPPVDDTAAADEMDFDMGATSSRSRSPASQVDAVLPDPTAAPSLDEEDLSDDSESQSLEVSS